MTLVYTGLFFKNGWNGLGRLKRIFDESQKYYLYQCTRVLCKQIRSNPPNPFSKKTFNPAAKAAGTSQESAQSVFKKIIPK
jgi:hypothetical protein